MRTQHEDLIRAEVNQRLDIRDFDIAQQQLCATLRLQVLIRDRELVQTVPDLVVTHKEAITFAT
jgi:hypothetical protein